MSGIEETRSRSNSIDQTERQWGIGIQIQNRVISFFKMSISGVYSVLHFVVGLPVNGVVSLIKWDRSYFINELRKTAFFGAGFIRSLRQLFWYDWQESAKWQSVKELILPKDPKI